MKDRLTTLVCVLALGFAGTTASLAQEQPSASVKPSVPVKAVDAVLVRPLCLASTVVGGTLFVLSLPVTAILKKTKPAADALVVAPAKATFTRPLGDMDAMAD